MEVEVEEEEQYRNMGEVIDRHPEVIEAAEEGGVPLASLEPWDTVFALMGEATMQEEFDALRGAVEDEALTEEGSVERGDPRARLDLRIARPATLGLIPYAIDEEKMARYSKDYEARYGKPPVRNPAYEDDWYVARDDAGQLTTFLKCETTRFRGDGVRLEGDQVVDLEDPVAAGCTHYFVDVENKLSITLNYKRAFLKDWKRMEDAVRDVLARTKAR